MNPSLRRFGAMLAATLLMAAALPAICAPSLPPWTASWAAAPQHYGEPAPVPNLQPAPPASLDDVSLRQRLLPGLDGRQARVRFSNLFGSEPLHIDAASLARSGDGAQVAGDTLRRLHFDGHDEVTIAPGAEAWSDPVVFALRAGQAVSVSLHVDRPTPFATVHQLAPGASWRVPGDAVLQPVWPSAEPSAWNHIVTGLDVASPGAPARVLVAFGDSITAGAGLSTDPSRPLRYPERLAVRLNRAGGRFAVLNAGISGNRLLADWVGPKGVDRFQRDALGQSGVTHALVLIGINDIGFSLPEGSTAGPVEGKPSAAELIAGLQHISDQARARGVKVLLGTLLPFKGSPTWNREKEHRRQLVNRWIRGRRMVDGVVDFDTALRDPKHPQALRPIFDSGDHLHPGETGTAAMANVVDLQLLLK